MRRLRVRTGSAAAAELPARRRRATRVCALRVQCAVCAARLCRCLSAQFKVQTFPSFKVGERIRVRAAAAAADVSRVHVDGAAACGASAGRAAGQAPPGQPLGGRPLCFAGRCRRAVARRVHTPLDLLRAGRPPLAGVVGRRRDGCARSDTQAAQVRARAQMRTQTSSASHAPERLTAAECQPPPPQPVAQRKSNETRCRDPKRLPFVWPPTQPPPTRRAKSTTNRNKHTHTLRDETRPSR